VTLLIVDLNNNLHVPRGKLYFSDPASFVSLPLLRADSVVTLEVINYVNICMHMCEQREHLM